MSTDSEARRAEVAYCIEEAERVLRSMNPYSTSDSVKMNYASAQALIAVAKILAHAIGLDKDE